MYFQHVYRKGSPSIWRQVMDHVRMSWALSECHIKYDLPAQQVMKTSFLNLGLSSGYGEKLELLIGLGRMSLLLILLGGH